MKSTHTEYRMAIELLYRERVSCMQDWVQSRFPRTCPGLVADAVADAFTDALGPDSSFFEVWRKGGQTELVRSIRQAAWRRLRGRLRRHSNQCEIAMPHLLDSEDVSTPRIMVCDSGDP